MKQGFDTLARPEMEGWKMPGEMEDCVALKKTADVAYVRFRALVEMISTYAAELEEDASRAEAPPLGWPRVDEITAAYLGWRNALSAATARYNSLPSEQRKALESLFKIERRSRK